MEDRFWSKVEKTPACWLWTAYLTRNGYGQVGWGKKLEYAHRIAYELLRGVIPLGMTIDHLCRNRACVNPSHMEVVSRGENVRRGFSPWAINARKTHCNKGHEFTPENTHLYNGVRNCRTCAKIKQSKWKEKQKAMNTIIIFAPRWHDKVVLVAERRILDHNEIVITAKDGNGQRYFPKPMYISGKQAKSYPLEQMKTKAGGTIDVRAIPLSILEQEQIQL